MKRLGTGRFILDFVRNFLRPLLFVAMFWITEAIFWIYCLLGDQSDVPGRVQHVRQVYGDATGAA